MTPTYTAPKWAFDFAQILANRDHVTWFVGVGLSGASIARSRELLLDVTSIASVHPRMQPHSGWKQSVDRRVSGGQP